MTEADEASPLIKDPADQNDNSETSRNTAGTQLLQNRNLLLLTTISVSNLYAAVSFAVLSPFFPGAAEAKGLSLTLTGLIIGEFELVIFLVSPFVVHIAASVGNKSTYVCGLFICGTCSVLFGLLQNCPPGSTFAVMCFLTRGVGAFGAAIFMVSSFAILARAFPDKVSTVTGIAETALGLGYMIGPALGGAFYDLGGFGLPFFTVGGLVLVTAVAAYFFTPALPVESGEHDEPVSFLKFFSIPIVFAILLSYAATGAMYGSFDVALEPFITDAFHYSSTIIGLIFLTPSLIYTLSAVVWGRLTDSMGWGVGVLIFGLIVCVFGVFFVDPPSFILPIQPTLYTLLPALVSVGLGSSAVMVPVYGLCLDAAFSNGMAESVGTINLVSGVTNSAYSLGVFIGPTVGGPLYELIGFDNLLFGYAGLFSLCAVFLGIMNIHSRYRRSRRSSSNSDSSPDPASLPVGASHGYQQSTAAENFISRSRRSSVSSLASHYSYQYTVQLSGSPSARRTHSRVASTSSA